MPFLISFVHTIAAQETGYQVDSAHIGVDALIQLEQSPPDSLLLDTTTADMDGYEVTRRIRQNAELPFSPIMLVADHNYASVVKGLALGANDVIRPTVKKRELFARIQSMLKLKQDLYFYKVDLWELSQNVVRELTPLAMTKGLPLNLTLVGVTDETSLGVRGDRLELRRLLTNLIGNAICYTDTGSVELRP